jgi:membrane protein DedA with SNARE-associated domain
MDFKKNLLFFAFVFPITFLIGLVVSFIVSLQFQEDVQINWVIVLAVATLLALLITWRNNRDAKRHKGEL